MKKFKSLVNCTAVMMFGMVMLQVPAIAQTIPPMPTMTPETTTKLTDPEIASVAVVANQVDIDYAKIAKEKSKDPEVIKFANMMIKDHQSVIDQATALVKKLNVTPKSNATSEKLLADSEKTKAMLRTKTGGEFNRAYIDNEVAYHKAVISVVEGTLIPDATNADLKNLLKNVVPVLKSHLEHAEMMQKQVATK